MLDFLPALLLLATVSLLPSLNARVWHRFYPLILSIFSAAALIIMFHQGSLPHLRHTMIEEFVPFITTIIALVVVCFNIKIHTNLVDIYPTCYLLLASLSSNLIGTMGASILFLRPTLEAAQLPRLFYVFYIVVVGNIGGFLTPLADPPLLLAYCKGISMKWMLTHHFRPWLLMLGTTLGVFYLYNSFVENYRLAVTTRSPAKMHFHIVGKAHFFSLVLILLTLLYSPLFTYKLLLHVTVMLIIITYTLFLQKLDYNTHSSLKETIIVFFNIFITLVPLLTNLKHLPITRPISPLLSFCLTGLFSSLLDNAPTYLIMLELNQIPVKDMLILHPKILLSTAAGAVFMGALTYIGNAPNWLVRSILNNSQVSVKKVPSFLAYSASALLICLPGFVLVYFFALH